VRSRYSCVRGSHDLCAHAHAHSLEGTLLISWWDITYVSFSEPLSAMYCIVLYCFVYMCFLCLQFLCVLVINWWVIHLRFFSHVIRSCIEVHRLDFIMLWAYVQMILSPRCTANGQMMYLPSGVTTWGGVRQLPQGAKRQGAPLSSIKIICEVGSIVQFRLTEYPKRTRSFS